MKIVTNYRNIDIILLSEMNPILNNVEKSISFYWIFSETLILKAYFLIVVEKLTV